MICFILNIILIPLILFFLHTIMPKIQKNKNTKVSLTTSKNKGKMPQNKISPKRISLTFAQKHELCFRKVNEPSIKNKELAEIYNVSEGCISNTLKKSQKWLEIDPQSPEAQGKRQVMMNFPEIEEALTLWILKALESGVNISDQVLHEKAMIFASLYKVENFKGSNGWIDGFKKRHNLFYNLNQEEATSVPLEELNEFGKKLQDLINKLEYTHLLTAEEYIRLDQENEISDEPLTEEQIITILEGNNSISDEDDGGITPVTSSEVLAAFDTIFIYLEQSDNQDIIDKNAFKAMKKARQGVYRNFKKQMSLNLFVTGESRNFKFNDTYTGVNNTMEGVNNNFNREGADNNFNREGADNNFNKEGIDNNFNREGVDNNFNRVGVDNNFNREGVDNNFNRVGVDNNFNREGVDNNFNREGIDNNFNREGIDNNIMNRESGDYYIMDVENVCFENLYFNELGFYNCGEGFQIDQNSFYS